MVCSNCADKAPSRVMTVQPSSRWSTSWTPRLIIGSMVKHMPRFSFTPGPGGLKWGTVGSQWKMRPMQWPE